MVATTCFIRVWNEQQSFREVWSMHSTLRKYIIREKGKKPLGGAIIVLCMKKEQSGVRFLKILLQRYRIQVSPNSSVNNEEPVMDAAEPQKN